MAVNEQWVKSQWQLRALAPIKFSTFNWLFDARSALYCVEKDALIVSDLHFEKGSFLRQYGSPIPALDSRRTLSTLASLIQDYRPQTLICLGDSFHDSQSLYRMSAQDQATLQSLMGSVHEWVWVVGNHDPVIPRLGGRVVGSLEWGSVTLQHEPLEDTHAAVIFGHFHPKHLLSMRQYQVTGKCFVMTATRMVLPSLGQYTGGLSIDSPALTAWFPKQHRHAWLIHEQKIYALA